MKEGSSSPRTESNLNESESLRFRQRLLMLHQIGNELSTINSFDELCRQAVVLGGQLLGYRRISLWFRQGKSRLMAGSFGVDEAGSIRDERTQLITAHPDSAMEQALDNKERILVSENSTLFNDKGDVVGKGTHVVAALRNGIRAIGCICMDNLLEHKPFAQSDFDLLAIYASTIGHLTHRRRAEDKLKKSLKEKEILLREINHRVKNNLQVILSLLNLQSTYARDPYDAEMFCQSQNRVKAMARVYETFSKTKDLTKINIHDYVIGVVQDLFNVYKIAPSSVILRWEGHHESFSLSQAIPCGLLVNELVTNALKHGFNCGKSKTDQLKGEIRITIGRLGRNLTVSIENDGNPFPPDVDAQKPRSLGLQLINALVAQLNGSITLDRTDKTRFTINFPDTAENAPMSDDTSTLTKIVRENQTQIR